MTSKKSGSKVAKRGARSAAKAVAKRGAKTAAKRKTATKGTGAGARPQGAKRASAPAGAHAPTSDYQDSWGAARDPDRSDRQRVDALAQLGSAACDDPAVFHDLLALIRDGGSSLAVRLAAVAAVQAGSFAAATFAERRPAYLAALRAVAKDPESEMRQRALGLLVREGDGRTQQLLLAGLEDSAKALVPPEKALQLLSYDMKGDAYPIARRIVQRPPNDAAKREALRLLAPDAKSTPLFERILLDKSEPADVRQIAAAALQALAPDTLQGYARDIVLDADESPDLQATSLTALTQFGQMQTLAQDVALTERVGALRDAGGPDAVGQSATQFLDKYLA